MNTLIQNCKRVDSFHGLTASILFTNAHILLYCGFKTPVPEHCAGDICNMYVSAPKCGASSQSTNVQR